MPSPNDMKPSNIPNIFSDLDKLLKPVDSDLVGEIRALRNEVASLRAELKPMSSMILTGQQIVAEFKQLALQREILI